MRRVTWEDEEAICSDFRLWLREQGIMRDFNCEEGRMKYGLAWFERTPREKALEGLKMQKAAIRHFLRWLICYMDFEEARKDGYPHLDHFLNQYSPLKGFPLTGTVKGMLWWMHQSDLYLNHFKQKFL